MSGRNSGPCARISMRIACALIAGSVLAAMPAFADVYPVKDQAAYEQAVKRLKPGDTVILANGVWRDFEIVFDADGKDGKPITLMAETPGKVIVSGRSNLRIGGAHLVVRGLTFRDGYSPAQEVVAFRRDADRLAENSRLTEVVIDGFSKPNRADEDQWIALFGKNNRVDHNYFAGKTNRGPTLVVRLNRQESRENVHLIDHNFFGHRPPLGGNGGETIRIGISDYSRTRSETTITRNFFERCDGEVEIVSVKSEGNRIAENVFYESRGAVVLRHGGNNTVSRNIFFGNGVPDTGGIRVINENQSITENYLEGLRGEKFLSALAIMNGVPHSPINRYHQVKNAEISQNSFIDFAAIGLAVGSDAERSAPPIDSSVTKNLFITDAAKPVSVFDDISGIAFDGNISNNPALATLGSTVISNIPLVRADNGLLYPAADALAAVGAPRDLDPVKRDETGPEWFKKPSREAGVSREKKIKGGGDEVLRALAQSRSGDVLRLGAGVYELDEPLKIRHAVSILGPANGDAAVLKSSAGAVIELWANADLTLKNLTLEATAANQSILSARGDSYEGAYQLKLFNISVAGAGSTNAIPFLSADAATFAEHIRFVHVNAKNWKGAVIAFSGANLDGWYLADDIAIDESRFEHVAGPLILFGRNSRDESTFGPRFELTNSILSDVGANGDALILDGIDGIEIRSNRIADSGAIAIRRRVLGLKFVFSDNALENTADPNILDIDGMPLTPATMGRPE